MRSWSKREVENYLAQPTTLLAWAQAEGERNTGGPLFAVGWRSAMENAIAHVESALATLGRLDRDNMKASDEYLTPIFAAFFGELGLPNLMNKSDFHQLANFIAPADIDTEVVHVLSAIQNAAAGAKPRAQT
jgi:hypothetical protein